MRMRPKPSLATKEDSVYDNFLQYFLDIEWYDNTIIETMESKKLPSSLFL